MSPDLRRTLRWGLIIGGSAGLLLSLAAIPTMWGAVTGFAKGAYLYEYQWYLPHWAQWHNLSVWGVPMMLGGALASLLLVTGRWLARGIALVMAAALAYSKIAFASGSYWSAWMANAADATPLTVSVLVSAILIVAASVAALLVAAHLRDE